eukprot:TRINITY_DN744_c0_g1_i11.p1 TRINITY_DN744_c0_g1~~TRINITY_DN744_c0_g1_i11.p1  ORF type:complete len:251 (+),score=50.82 TRINITY_DN744_c0_g1_i11:108-755(+)
MSTRAVVAQVRRQPEHLQLAKLKMELDLAVRLERYGEAARLRDALSKLCPIELLQVELNQAVAEQRFSDAIDLRDKIQLWRLRMLHWEQHCDDDDEEAGTRGGLERRRRRHARRGLGCQLGGWWQGGGWDREAAAQPVTRWAAGLAPRLVVALLGARRALRGVGGVGARRRRRPLAAALYPKLGCGGAPLSVSVSVVVGGWSVGPCLAPGAFVCT